MSLLKCNDDRTHDRESDAGCDEKERSQAILAL